MTTDDHSEKAKASSRLLLPFAYEVDQVRISKAEEATNFNVPFDWVHVDNVIFAILQDEVATRAFKLPMLEALEGAWASLRFTKLDATPFAKAPGATTAPSLAELGLRKADLKIPIIVYRLPAEILTSDKPSDAKRFVVLDGIKRILVARAYQLREIKALEIDYCDMLNVSRRNRVDFTKSFVRHWQIDKFEEVLREKHLDSVLAEEITKAERKEIAKPEKEVGSIQHPSKSQLTNTTEEFRFKGVHRSVVAVSTDSRVEDGAGLPIKIGAAPLSATTNFLEEAIVVALIARDRLLDFRTDDIVARLRTQLKIASFSSRKIAGYANRITALVSDLDSRPINIEKILFGNAGKKMVIRRMNSLADSIAIFRMRQMQWDKTGHTVHSNLLRLAHGRERFRTDNLGYLHFGSGAFTLTPDQGLEVAIWTGLNPARICVEHRMLLSVFDCATRYHDELFGEVQEPTIYMVHQWAAYRARKKYSDNRFTKLWRRLDSYMQVTGSSLRERLDRDADNL